MMTKTVLKIEKLTKNYKMYTSKKDRITEMFFPKLCKHTTFTAIDNFNLELKEGEILGILGKNGAGKSTLLKMITGVVTPSDGNITTTGKISSLLELGTAFNLELTGIENIYQHGQVMGLTNEEIKAKEQEIIDFADIGDHLYQPVKTYSSGMFARLAFACAINVEPDILIVDEVLSVGDMTFQLKCFKKFEEFKKANKTIIFVTHNIFDILRNCNRAIIIDAGKKIFDGDAKEGVDQYKKVIVGLSNEESTESNQKESLLVQNGKKSHANFKNMIWKKHFDQNKDIIEYGNDKADIIDYGVFTLEGDYANLINNFEPYIIKMKVKFNEEISEPIFAISIKDFKGLELCGVNTLIYQIPTGKYQKGETVVIEFKQLLPLAPEKYTLSFGCTKMDSNGDLEVFSRKYDAFFITVTSNRNALGLIDLQSDINILR